MRAVRAFSARMGFRITTWNVNGIRNPFGYQPWRENRTYQAMFDTLEADIVVMQECKIQRKDLQDDMVLIPGWDVHFSLPKSKKGYSGVAVYTRNSKCCPIRTEEGITGALFPPNLRTKFRDLPQSQQIGGYPRPGQLSGNVDEVTLDSEGRCVILEFPAFVLIGVYSPATRDDSRIEFRIGFLEALDIRVRNLVQMGKEVFLCGDLNIIRSDLDTAGLQDQLRKEEASMVDFFSSPSRRFLNQIVHGGQVFQDRDEGREQPVLWDLCREFHPTRQGMYTCWEVKKNARPGNFGSRIDYVLCSTGIKSWIHDADIQQGLMGSDHCPVYATFSDIVHKDEQEVHLLDLINPEGMFKAGERLRQWSLKDLLPTSARLIPDFGQRRSIRDMFIGKSATATLTGKGPQTSHDSSDVICQSCAPQPGAVSPASDLDVHTASQSPSALSSPSASLAKPAINRTKRPSESSGATRPQKKSRQLMSKTSSTKAGPGLAQSSLMGFFKPQSSSAGTSNLSVQVAGSRKEVAPTHAVQSAPKKEDKAARAVVCDEQQIATTSAAASNEEKIFHATQVKESWSKLLGKRTLPKCEHGEDCVSFVTKKAGVNCGRSFYMCSRPLGPSGDKEIGTEFRCRTFIWCSDWSGRPTL